MAIKKGLGKGLDALLGDYQQPPEESVKEIDVNLIDTNSSQPRKSFDKEKLVIRMGRSSRSRRDSSTVCGESYRRFYLCIR